MEECAQGQDPQERCERREELLIEREIKELERIVSMYLDHAENQAVRQIPMKMADWVAKLDAFLQFNEYEVLANAGKVSAEVAKSLAEMVHGFGLPYYSVLPGL